MDAFWGLNFGDNRIATSQRGARYFLSAMRNLSMAHKQLDAACLASNLWWSRMISSRILVNTGLVAGIRADTRWCRNRTKSIAEYVGRVSNFEANRSNKSLHREGSERHSGREKFFARSGSLGSRKAGTIIQGLQFGNGSI